MRNRYIRSLVVTALLGSLNADAMDFKWSLGTHDFVVSNIKNDVPLDGIEAGDSHTLGVNSALYVSHTTATGIHFDAKAEAFLDYDKDELDPDHIPIWFDFTFNVDGEMLKLNDTNSLKWLIKMDNRQNTVSCVEREVRQHLGVGYQYQTDNFTFNADILAGFYYIEFDDDTPVNRGYGREDTDDGEASHVYIIDSTYRFNKSWNIFGEYRHYAANMGAATLEDNVNVLVSYMGSDVFGEGTGFHLKAKYVKYDISRFYKESIGHDIVPFDNDTLIQAYVTIPVKF